MRYAAPSSPVLRLQTPWKASATGNFANASRRVPRAAYAVTLLATRRPNLSLFRPKGSLSAPLFDTSIRSLPSPPPPHPKRTSEIASGTVPDRIFVASPEISLLQDACRVINIYSLGEERRDERLWNFAWIRFVFESDILERGTFSFRFGNLGISFFFLNALKYFSQ